MASTKQGKPLPKKNLQQYIGIRALAKILGVSFNSLRRWESSGHLPASVRLGVKGHRRWKVDDIERFLLSRKEVAQ